MRYENMQAGRALIDMLHVGKSADAKRYNVECLVKDILYTSGLDVSMGVLPKGATVLACLACVRTAFAGGTTTGTVSVGIAGGAQVYMTTTVFAETVAGLKGFIPVTATPLAAATEVLIDVTAPTGSGLAGAATIALFYLPA